MAIIFSRKCELGIQAVLYLASVDGRAVIPSEEIASELKIPKEFISKILQELTASGIVSSKKGKMGGFSLAKKPNKIHILDIVLAIDGSDVFSKCVLGFPNCSDETPCPMHNTWSQLIDETFKMLNEETIDQFKNKVLRKIESLK
ncbi:MAG: transcriptional regulator [Ignavibacteria bacterium CG22_combo_CG10-13_8_21_14_all_37_15]|nr:Rrf2 family transcriptional regulator [Ignavibacteria bacterium]OIO16017.1 MAG: transcriptional regulator [Ignavibacteria bacterium CG1_02_37_35]PIP77369.1 MAG: transcriptional regulator [Ignavibacteria bacterium CG22_combo_CG10-13_8_21_14_all_37_15]PIS44810.1 MAG: Rrf2 family transcriptional regulator [Ignavibacteria bacterium CG08_land_8_20_14_0_20_37_9]PIX93400.1 MAG: Rrf2 family transcriptional regulator [Ignavibacteria bacterium CG_4_10_14_3_um_filter_37_18]PJC59256.1 MAG: Rrf2 family 